MPPTIVFPPLLSLVTVTIFLGPSWLLRMVPTVSLERKDYWTKNVGDFILLHHLYRHRSLLKHAPHAFSVYICLLFNSSGQREFLRWFPILTFSKSTVKCWELTLPNITTWTRLMFLLMYICPTAKSVFLRVRWNFLLLLHQRKEAPTPTLSCHVFCASVCCVTYVFEYQYFFICLVTFSIKFWSNGFLWSRCLFLGLQTYSFGWISYSTLKTILRSFKLGYWIYYWDGFFLKIYFSIFFSFT